MRAYFKSMQMKKDLLIMYFCAAVAMCLLYAPQPIAPVFESELGISRAKAGLFITALMVPLALASILYGYLLEKISIRTALGVGFFLLGGAQIVFSLSSEYFWLLNIRGFEGLIIPVAMTGIMSYISQTTPKDQIASAIGAYIGVTIIGGFLGRFLSGLCTDYFGWRFFIIIIGAMCLLCALLVSKYCANVSASFLKPKLRDIACVLKTPHNLYIYLAMFGIFFAFQAVLNYMPFELSYILGGEFSGTKIGAMYLGYALGVIISFNVKRIACFFGSPLRAMIAGGVIFVLGLQFLHIQSYLVFFAVMLSLCIGFFISHAMASAFINKMADEHKGIANGLYVSFYYCGGGLGSVLPGIIYLHSGWDAFLLALSVINILALVSLAYLWALQRKNVA